ncbi:MAG TPA: GNAT family N-acetyltransferase, partial [Kineosporiaceae bacterium]|nr:GNAT family N-acetyltransferase [Kineosporiaceae bacterium]
RADRATGRTGRPVEPDRVGQDVADDSSGGGSDGGAGQVEVRVRRAVPADAAAIAGVHVRTWQRAYRGLLPQHFLDGLDPVRRVEVWAQILVGASWPARGTLVAEDGGRVIGFAAICPSRDGDGHGTGELAAIYVDPACWGTGAGRALMDAAVTALAGAGFAEATLWVLAANVRARRFYTAAGWLTDGAAQEDQFGGVTVREVRYRRLLPAPA